MNSLIIQVHRCNEWRKVTTVNFDRDRKQPLVRGNNITHSRETAMREAMSALTAWSGYFLEPVRLIETSGYHGSEQTVIAGGRG